MGKILTTQTQTTSEENTVFNFENKILFLMIIFDHKVHFNCNKTTANFDGNSAKTFHQLVILSTTYKDALDT
jgi:hypothetical protein